MSARCVWERDEMRKTMKIRKISRETKKDLKSRHVFAKICDFRDQVKLPASRQGKLRNTLKTRFLKIFLRVFCDWKVYPRGIHKFICENLCIPLATGPSTCEQVANMSCKKHEKPIFLKNILSIFHDWGIYPLVSREKSLYGIVTRACNWANLLLSRQNRATLV